MGCIICGAARRAENSIDPFVRDATGTFVSLLQQLARCSVPPRDCVAAVVAWWNKQPNVPITPAEQEQCVFLHMYHCRSAAWALRISLIQYNLQAAAAVAAVAQHGATKDNAAALEHIALSAASAISLYRMATPGSVRDVVIHNIPDIPVPRWCVFCHSPSGIRKRLYDKYAEILGSGNSGTIADIAETLADGLSEDDLVGLSCTPEKVADDAHRHYLVHDASPLALVHRLTTAATAAGISSVFDACAVESGTLVPKISAGAVQLRKAVIAITRLMSTVARVPGTERFGGMPAQGLRFVLET